MLIVPPSEAGRVIVLKQFANVTEKHALNRGINLIGRLAIGTISERRAERLRERFRTFRIKHLSYLLLIHRIAYVLPTSICALSSRTFIVIYTNLRGISKE